MTNTSFIGSWLVSEYVYTPAGEYVGVIHQRRQLIPKDDVIRVIQYCEPVKVTTELSQNAKDVLEIMNKRVGEFVFDLKQTSAPQRRAEHKDEKIFLIRQWGNPVFLKYEGFYKTVDLVL